MQYFRIILVALSYAVLPGVCNAQHFDGFVITESDSLIKGFMRTSIEHTGRKKIEITSDKRKKPHAYYMEDIRFYAFKKDTFAILKNFYPFEGEEYYVELLEARVIVSKGAVRMYSVALPNYNPRLKLFSTPSATGVYVESVYPTFVLEDNLHVRRALRSERDKFYDSVEPMLGDDVELMSRIRNKEFRFKDTRAIVDQYNRTRRLKRYNGN